MNNPIAQALLILTAFVSSSCDRGQSPLDTLGSTLGSKDTSPSEGNAYQWVTGSDKDEDQQRWDSIYDVPYYVYGKEPSEFLRANLQLLPLGRALDIAMGEGRNAVFLAKKGFVVDGVDYSQVAIRKAVKLARESKVTLSVIKADLTQYDIPVGKYEVVVNIDFLHRPLIPKIKKALKPGGIIVFEAETVDQVALARGQALRKDQLLERGELRELFSDFEVLAYREVTEGKQAKARLIARKRP